MSSSFEKFKALHYGSESFLLPNAWDARSAIVFQECGYPAIGTSSAAVANSLGLEDGENMRFQDYLFVIKRIFSSVSVPLTVDIEMGYGSNDDEIAENVCHLASIGVAGINIEDSTIDGQDRKLKDANAFAQTIDHIKSKLKSKDLDLFINVRCDAHILNVPRKQHETLNRILVYNSSSADGLFVPCIANAQDIAEVVGLSKLPLNVMSIPPLPGIDELNDLGVKRISMGPFAFQKVYKEISELSKAIASARTLAPLFQ